MKRLTICLLFLAFALPALAQSNGRLSPDDQRRFDSYFQRWQEYKRANNREETISMEKRMQDVMVQYNLPLTTPYSEITSSRRDEDWDHDHSWARWHGRLNPDDQHRFDSYFQRCAEYKASNAREEVISMEERMQDIMVHYNVPLTVPYRVLTSNWREENENNWGYEGGHWGRDHDRDHDHDWRSDRDHDSDHDQHAWRGRLSSDDQRRFDSYYTRWLDDQRDNKYDETRSMESRMLELMRQYNIREDVLFREVASRDVASRDMAEPNRGHSEGLRILDASYGSGRNQVNVTDRIQSLVQNGRLGLAVNNDTMGGDPVPHVRKTLTLTYSSRGREQRVSVVEGGALSIP